jgi:hypothetical protein
MYSLYVDHITSSLCDVFEALLSLKLITNHAIKVVDMQCLNRIYTYGGAWHQGWCCFPHFSMHS